MAMWRIRLAPTVWRFWHREHQIPLYVVAPRSTIDLSLPNGEAIPIEERARGEVTTFAGRRVWLPRM